MLVDNQLIFFLTKITPILFKVPPFPVKVGSIAFSHGHVQSSGQCYEGEIL